MSRHVTGAMTTYTKVILFSRLWNTCSANTVIWWTIASLGLCEFVCLLLYKYLCSHLYKYMKARWFGTFMSFSIVHKWSSLLTKGVDAKTVLQFKIGLKNLLGKMGWEDPTQIMDFLSTPEPPMFVADRSIQCAHNSWCWY